MSTLERLSDRRPRLPYLLFLSLRMNIWRHRTMALLTVAAVAASAALATGLEIASRAVRTELRETAEAVIGSAQLEVVATKRGIPEELIDEVGAVPGVLSASPLITETFRIAEGELEGRPIHVLGVDLLAQHPTREYDVTKNKVKVRDPLLLMAKVESVILSETLTERLGIKEGDTLAVRTPKGRKELQIEGILAKGGLADAYAGQIAVMDVWSLQTLLDVRGWIDKIEVTVADGVEVEGVVGHIKQRTAAAGTVRLAGTHETWADSILSTLDLAAWGIGLVAILASCLLAYAAIAHLVERRMENFALMRCIGLDESGVRRLIRLDALTFSAVGACIGFTLGIAGSPLLVDAFSRFSQHLQGVSIEEASPQPTTITVAACVWLFISLLATAQPARASTRRHPIEILTQVRVPLEAIGFSKRYVYRLILALTAIAALMISQALPAGLEFVLVFGIGVACVVATSGPLIRFTIRHFAYVFGRIPRVGILVGSSIIARTSSTSMCVASIVAVVASVTMVLVVSYSLTASLDEWVEKRTQGAMAVWAGSPMPGLTQEPLLDDTIDKIRAQMGDENVAIFSSTFEQYQGEEVLLGALSSDVLLQHGGFYPDDTPPAALAAALDHGHLAMSHAFENRFGVEVGDWVTLETRNGPHDFRIGGYYRDYSGIGGALHMDLATFDRHFYRGGADFLRIWTTEPEKAIDGIFAEVGDRQPLFFRYGTRVRTAASEALGRFENLLVLLAAVMSFFSAIALINLIAGALAAKRKDFALMQVGGASWGNIAAVILIDSGIVVATGATLGILLGLVCSESAMRALFERFGWIVNERAGLPSALGAAGSIFLVSVVGSIIPAVLTRRRPAASQLVAE